MADADIRTAMEAGKEFVQDYEYMSAYDRQEKYERDRKAREDFVREEASFFIINHILKCIAS